MIKKTRELHRADEVLEFKLTADDWRKVIVAVRASEGRTREHSERVGGAARAVLLKDADTHLRIGNSLAEQFNRSTPADPTVVPFNPDDTTVRS